LGAAPAAARARFQADLGAALQVAALSTTQQNRNSENATFGRWATFCAGLSQDPGLSGVPDHEDKLCYLLVFAMRYRRTGARGHPVRADAVEKALLAVGKGMANLGVGDPRKASPGSDRNHPVLAAFIKRLNDEDEPATRAYPANLTIIEALFDVLDTAHPEWGTLNAHLIDLNIVAFYWLLRPAEYLHSETAEGRTQAFKLQNVCLTIHGRVYAGLSAPLNDVNSISLIAHASLTFTDQKNAVRGKTVGHRANDHPLLCPAKALGRIILRHRQWKSSPDVPLHHHYNAHAKHKLNVITLPRAST